MLQWYTSSLQSSPRYFRKLKSNTQINNNVASFFEQNTLFIWTRYWLLRFLWTRNWSPPSDADRVLEASGNNEDVAGTSVSEEETLLTADWVTATPGGRDARSKGLTTPHTHEVPHWCVSSIEIKLVAFGVRLLFICHPFKLTLSFTLHAYRNNDNGLDYFFIRQEEDNNVYAHVLTINSLHRK